MSTPHKTRAHAVLGASSSKRWMTCPGSVRQSIGMPNTSSVYAKEGTAAHQLAEMCLRSEKPATDYLGTAIEVEGDSFEVDYDMARAVQVYLDEVARLLNTPELGVLHVLDYKHGRGVAVEAENNTQGMYYALGALLELSGKPIKGRLLIEHKFDLSAIHPGLFGTNDACVVNGPVRTVEITIVQPRCDHDDGPIRRWRLHVLDLFDWSVDLADAARKTEDPEAALVPGDHCKFCPAAGACPELQMAVFDRASAEFGDNSGELVLPAPEKMDSDMLGRLVKDARMFEDWVRAVLEYAHHEAEAGRMPTGFKLVPKRATRKWKDDDAAAEFLEKDAGLDPSDIYTIKPKSPAQIEKVLGNDRKDLIADMVEKVSSGSTLAPLADKRKSKAEEAVADFAPVE